MIGAVSPDLEPTLPLRLRSANGEEIEVEFVVDTGFTGELALPRAVLSALDAPFSHAEPARLADGSWITVDVHEVDVEWDGSWTTAFADALGSALLGVKQCEGYQLAVAFTPGGAVSIERD